MRRSTVSTKKRKRVSLGLIFVVTLASLLSCGGGGSRSLSVSSDDGSTQMTLGTFGYHGITVSAKFSDGTTPSSVSWSSGSACIGIRGPVEGLNGVIYENKADAACNFNCGSGAYNGTITATAEGLTGTLPVSCQITN